MIRYFCDCCGKEIPADDAKFRNPLQHRLSAKIKRGNSELSVQVLEIKDNVSNAGHFCRYCVLDALYTLDDRPTEVVSPGILHQTFSVGKVGRGLTVKAWLEVRDGVLIGMHQVSETNRAGVSTEYPAKETGVIAELK